jgi:hypothetical protein
VRSDAFTAAKDNDDDDDDLNLADRQVDAIVLKELTVSTFRAEYGDTTFL